MDEITNAIPEGGASPSTDNGAASAGGDGANQGQESSTQGQIATPTLEEFSAGWNFEDEVKAESDVTEGEEDISALLTDPNLDQAQVPKLVQDLRGARAESKQQKAEIRRLTEENARLSQNGYGLASDLIADPIKGAASFMAKLAKDALPAYQAIADELVKYEPEYLVLALQAAGKIPEAQASAGQLTAEDWARIPEALRDIAKQVPVNQLLQWLDSGSDETLQFNLQTQKELADLKGAQREQAEQQWRTAVQQAENSGRQSIESLSDQYEKAHYAQLAKWQPFGPNDPQNQFLYTAILEGANAILLQEKQWQDVYRDATGKLQNAPLRRLRNDHLGADADERDARGMAARYNARLGQVMKAQIQKLDSIFKDARAYREQQRQNIPDRTEIPGKSSTIAASSNGKRLTTDGRISDEYMEELRNRHGIGR